MAELIEDRPLIQTRGEVEALAESLRRERVLAVDTEADSFFHYYDKLCLLQIGTREQGYLIDPLALPEQGLAPLEPIFSDPNVRKVFHAAEYDMYILQRYGGIKVQSLFDTMISAQLLGYPAVGLGALVEHHFGITLSKDQQRTDWSRRPLRPAQTEYALSDVLYLIELSEFLEKELSEKQRLSWATREFQTLEERVWPKRSFDRSGYLRIKGAKQLPADGLAVLRELYLMRDKRARQIDRPPFKVLGNGTLLDLARRPPATRRSLLGRKGITDLVVRRFGPEILEAVERGTSGPEHPPLERKPAANARRRLDRRGELRLERLKSWRARRAGELAIDPGVFCPNSALEEIAGVFPKRADDFERLQYAKGWWVEAFANEVIEQLDSEDQESQPDKAHESEEGSSPRKSQRSRRRRGSRGRRSR